MSVTLSNQSLALIASVGAFSALGGGIVYLKAVGTTAAVGGVFATAGLIAMLSVAAFVGYRYYTQSLRAMLPDGDFLPPLNAKPQVFALDAVLVFNTRKDNVPKTFNVPALVQSAIFGCFADKEIASTAQVCKAWNRWTSADSVWKNLCDREGIPPIKRKGEIDPKTGKNITLFFYKEAYLRLRPMIFMPQDYTTYLNVKVHGKITRLKDDIHAKIFRLDPSYLDPLPLAPNAPRKYRLNYLSKAVEQASGVVSPMTMNLLGELMQAPGVRNPTKYGYVWKAVREQCGEATMDSSDYFLISANVIQGTRNRTYPNQVITVAALGGRAPKLIEAIALNFFDHARFNTYPYGQNPWTYSRTDATITLNNVEYHLVVGGFAPSGLDVCLSHFVNGSVGLAAAFSCGSSAGLGT